MITSPLDLKSNLGLGTGKLKGESGVQAVEDAIDAGYRLFDTAFLYGNEAVVGEAISKKISEGCVRRDEIFIVSKLWGIHHGQVERACRDSCERLRVEFVDLYLFHFPVSFAFRSDEDKWPRDSNDIIDNDYLDVWREMEKLVAKGLVKHIGVSNFNAQQLQRVYDNATIKPSCNEIEFHPSFCRFDLVKLCKDLTITVLAFCPIGRPKPGKYEPKFLHDTKVQSIATKYNKTSAQIALRFAVQSDVIPIPKSATKARIIENISINDFNLTNDEMNYLASFHNLANQICKFHFAESSKNYPF